MFFVLAYPLTFVAALGQDELADLFSAHHRSHHIPILHPPPHEGTPLTRPSVSLSACAHSQSRNTVSKSHRNVSEHLASTPSGPGSDRRLRVRRMVRRVPSPIGPNACARNPASRGPGSEWKPPPHIPRKLQSALESVDRHVDAVRTGFLECREKIDAMERRIDDVAQIRQLGRLAACVWRRPGVGEARALAKEREITEELLGEGEELGAAVADLSRLASVGASTVAGEDVEQLAEVVVTQSEEANRAIEGLGVTGTDEAQDPTPPQSKSPDTPVEPEPSVAEPPEAPPKREAQPSPKPWPDPAERIAELKRQRIAREADSEQRMQGIGAQSEQRERESEQREHEIRARSEQRERDYEQRKREIQAEFKQREREIQAEYEQRQGEIRAESEQRGREAQAEVDRQRREMQARSEQREREYEQREQEMQAGFEGLRQQVQAETVRRRQEILTESLRRRQEIYAKHELDPPATPPDPESASIDRLGTTPEEHPPTPAPEDSASPETPSEPESGVIETPEATPKREAQPVESPPEPEDRIAELRAQRIAREADFEQRKQELRARLQQRKKRCSPTSSSEGRKSGPGFSGERRRCSQSSSSAARKSVPSTSWIPANDPDPERAHRSTASTRRRKTIRKPRSRPPPGRHHPKCPQNK